MSSYSGSYRRSILENFTLTPLPYPVLLLLGVISLFLGLQWYVSYDSLVEATEESMGWLLMAAPLLLLFAVRWLSASDDDASWLYGWGGRRRHYLFGGAEEGSASPWGVAALILLLLIMVQYQSVFLDSWFV